MDRGKTFRIVTNSMGEADLLIALTLHSDWSTMTWRLKREPPARAVGKRSASALNTYLKEETFTTSGTIPKWTSRLPQTEKRRCLHSSKKSAGSSHLRNGERLTLVEPRS